jgi:hypothetical protein
MSMMTIFKSRAASMGYVFKTGKSIHFTAGQYATESKVEIDELTAECEAGHPTFYIDPECKTLDSELLDPVAAMRAQIREEERAKLIASADPRRDMGETKQEAKLQGVGNSSTIRGLQADSSSMGAPIAVGTIKIASTSPSK